MKFYQASSSEMFGKNYTSMRVPSRALDKVLGSIFLENTNAENVTEEKKYQNEETPFMPQSPYAIAKLAAHHLVRNYRDSYGIFACSGILFNHESERRGEKFVTRKITKWIGEFVTWMQENKGFIDLSSQKDNILLKDEDTLHGGIGDVRHSFPKLRLGNLDARRDWGHAQDYVDAMWLMLQQENPDDYVVATGKTYSVREFLDIAFKHIQIRDWEDYVVIDPEFYRPAEVDYLLGVPTKAKKSLGWSPEISFKKLVKRMVESDINEAQLRRSGLQSV